MRPVVVEADLDLLQLAALVRRRDEVLAPVLDPLDLVAEPARRPRHQHLLRPRVHDLDAEAAAHHRRDALDLAGRQARAGPRPRPAPTSTSASTSAPASSRRPGPTGRARPCPPSASTRCARRRGRAAAGAAPPPSPCRRRRPPAAGGPRRCPARPRARCGAASRAAATPTTGGQEVVGHDDPLGGVLGQVAVACHHHDDRLADVVDLVARQRVAGARRVQRGVRDEQRQRVRDGAALGLVGRDQVVVGVDGDQAVDLQGAARVDVDDPGVRVRAADERDAEGVVADVVEEVRRAGDQLGVLDPLDRLAEELGGHGAPSPTQLRRG